MRRLTTVLVILSILVLPMLPSSYADEQKTVEYNENGQFKILIIADAQNTDKEQQAMQSLIKGSLEESRPDLVVFLGDMIYGPSIHGRDNVEKAIRDVINPVVDAGIPFVMVFGDNDSKCGIPIKEQRMYYQKWGKGYCIIPEEGQCSKDGDYCIRIDNPFDENKQVVLWFIESGNSVSGSLTKEQIDWMKNRYEAIKENGSNPVSYVFQHIPVHEVYELLERVPFGTKESVYRLPDILTCYKANRLEEKTENTNLESPKDKTEGVPKEGFIKEGYLRELPASLAEENEEFTAWKEMNVKGAFFGHDLLNDYCGQYDGIDLVATTSAGFYKNGRGEEHGTRIITIDAKKTDKYKTKMLYYKDVVSEPVSGMFISTLGVLDRQIIVFVLDGILILIISICIVIRHVKKEKESEIK